MFRSRDVLLLAVSFGSLLTGILAPEVCAPLQPYPLVCMMLLLFLSFLSIRISQIWETARQTPLRIAAFLFFRMIVFPAAAALLVRAVWPAYSLATLLLTGISTGAVAPFFANLLQANMAFVLVSVVASSLLVPFTLPPLVAVLFGRTMEIPLLHMMRLLIVVVFIPLAAAEVLKSAAPQVADHELYPGHRIQRPVLLSAGAHRCRALHPALLCPGDPRARLAHLENKIQAAL
jgi:BASS family bile acid:Na+ symporter